MKTLGMAVAVILLACLGIVGFAWSGRFDVSAANPHTRIVSWALHTIMRRSVPAHAAGIFPPATLADLGERGAGDFDEMCVQCHGAPGKEAGEIGKGLNPKPPGLDDAANRWSASELFWIVKNGVQMTGMPAFGPTHDDDRIWAIVAFVRTLPGMTPAEYAKRTAADQSSPEHSHHDHDGQPQHEHDH